MLKKCSVDQVGHADSMLYCSSMACKALHSKLQLVFDLASLAVDQMTIDVLSSEQYSELRIDNSYLHRI